MIPLERILIKQPSINMKTQTHLVGSRQYHQIQDDHFAHGNSRRNPLDVLLCACVYDLRKDDRQS
jgi:hypothetical protein